MDRFIATNGIQLHCLDHSGGGPPLVLMPGLTANAHSFDGLIDAGLNPSLRVLALDLRGRGLSDKPVSGYGIADHAADVIGLLDALELPQVILGGHSFGGLLTIYLAAHHPERFSKLVVIDAAARMHPDTMELIKPSVSRLGKEISSWETYLDTIRQMPFFHEWWEPLIENYFRADVEIKNDGTVISLARPETIMQAAAGLMTENWQLLLSKVHQPLLLLNATGPFGPPGTPPILPRKLAMETVSALPEGHYVEIPTNHITMLFGERAAKMTAAIRSFIGR
jgi:pimeloyl-ACP methyl ester carboxylesterase